MNIARCNINVNRACETITLLAGMMFMIAALAGCTMPASKDDIEAAKNTYACQLSGERLVIRFDSGEARLLMPGATRVTLYQIPTASGLRYSNGVMELRGRGMDLQLIQEGVTTALAGCEQFPVPQ
jgi:membrane-bound inhibitor of C-type lysozyme